MHPLRREAKSGNPEWSAKRNKYCAKKKHCAKHLQKQLIEPQKCKKPWTDNFKASGDKQKQNSGIRMSPTALKCRPLQPVRAWSRIGTIARPVRSSAPIVEGSVEESDVPASRLYEAHIHSLNTEIANMTEKSQFQATLSAKMCSVESARPIVDAASQESGNP